LGGAQDQNKYVITVASIIIGFLTERDEVPLAYPVVFVIKGLLWKVNLLTPPFFLYPQTEVTMEVTHSLES